MRDARRTWFGYRLVRASIALAALRFFGHHWTSVHDLRRDPLGHRLFPSRFLERVEMEPARISFPERIVDLRRLRFRRLDRSGAPIAHRAIHSA